MDDVCDHDVQHDGDRGDRAQIQRIENENCRYRKAVRCQPSTRCKVHSLKVPVAGCAFGGRIDAFTVTGNL